MSRRINSPWMLAAAVLSNPELFAAAIMPSREPKKTGPERIAAAGAMRRHGGPKQPNAEVQAAAEAKRERKAAKLRQKGML